MKIVQTRQWRNQHLNNTICLAKEKITRYFFYIKMNNQIKTDQPESKDA